jgi:hypothetical protein
MPRRDSISRPIAPQAETTPLDHAAIRAGFPDGIFSKQILPIGVNFGAMADAGIFYGHLVYIFTAFWYILCSFGIFSRFGMLYQENIRQPYLGLFWSIWYVVPRKNPATLFWSILFYFGLFGMLYQEKIWQPCAGATIANAYTARILFALI